MTSHQDDAPNETVTSPGRLFLDPQGRFLIGQGSWDPPEDGEMIEILIGFLERQRATFAWKCSSLDAVGLRATVGASALTLGGMLKHLARFEDDMSTEWLMGQPQLAPWDEIDWAADGTWDWRTAADEASEELYARWQQAVVRSRGLFHQERGRAGSRVSLILINMIEEYARHNGHADLIREAHDGLIGHDPPT